MEDGVLLSPTISVEQPNYANGKSTPCRDVFPSQAASCSDLNTTDFIDRLLHAEKPHLIVFTGDNIYGSDSTDAVKSLNAAFDPAITSQIPWAAVLGNHDQESSSLTREGVMKYVVGMKNTVSRLNPPEVPDIDGYGNYNLEVHGVEDSPPSNKSVLNLFLLDSGDYSKVRSIPGYDWIKPSQQNWFQQTSKNLQYFNEDRSPYTSVEINETREIFASFMMRNHLTSFIKPMTC